MQKRIPATAIFLALGIFAGCARNVSRTANFGTPDNVLSYGVYTATALDSGMSVKLNLNQNGTYSKKKFLGSCFMMEYKGDWKCDNESIEFALEEIRHRPDCNSESWQTEKTRKQTHRMIRSVTTTSFELLDQDSTTSAEWIRFVKR
jgi:hypothetical protein